MVIVIFITLLGSKISIKIQLNVSIVFYLHGSKGHLTLNV